MITKKIILCRFGGRYNNAVGSDNKYFVLGTLNDMEYIIKRILEYNGDDLLQDDYNSFNTIITLDDFKQQKLHDYHEVLEFFLFLTKCQHIILEEKLSNPFLAFDNDIYEPCKTLCQFCCNNGNNSIIPKIKLAGLKEILSKLFIGSNAIYQPGISTELVDGIRNFRDCQMLVFGSKKKTKPNKYIISRIVMMLITAKLIGYQLINVESERLDNDGNKITVPKLIAYLTTDSNNTPNIFNDKIWEIFPLLPSWFSKVSN